MIKLQRLTEADYLQIRSIMDAKEDTSDVISTGGRVYNEVEMMYLLDACADFWLTSGYYTKIFEEQLGKFLNIKHVLFVNSGSSANLLAFIALTSPLLGSRAIQRGDEVITTACCFPTTISPIVQYGAVPVFIDIDQKTLNVDTTLLERALSPKTKAIMLAHTLGNPFNLEYVQDFCKKHNLWLIEDNCDSLGSSYQGQYTGTFGDIGTSSFYPAHHITTGEGGAVYTNNDLLAKILRSLRDWGRECTCDTGEDNSCGARFHHSYDKLPYGYDHKYVYSHLGFNLKGTDLQAAIGCGQLEKLSRFIQIRKSNYYYLRNHLGSLQDVLQFQIREPHSDPSWFGFAMTIKNGTSCSRNDLVEWLEAHKIQTRFLFAGNIIYHPCFNHLTEGVDFKVASTLSSTNKVLHNTLWCGVHPKLKTVHLNRIISTIHQFFRRGSS